MNTLKKLTAAALFAPAMAAAGDYYFPKDMTIERNGEREWVSDHEPTDEDLELIVSKANQHVENELACLAEAIYFEARGEPVRGQEAVAMVIRNRVNSKRYPDSYCGVVRQHAQFSYYWDGKPETIRNHKAFATAYDIAERVFLGERDFTGGSTHYFAHKIVTPAWADKTVPMLKVGNHVFKKEL